MKTALILVLICTSSIALAQQKATWQLVLELNGSSSKADVQKHSSAVYYLLDTPNHIFRGYISEGSSRASTSIRPGVTGGFTVSYPVKKNLLVRAGVMVNYYSFENITTTNTRMVDTAMMQIPQGATYFPGRVVVVPAPTRTEVIVGAVAIDIPIGVRISPNASRWIIETEIIPSFTLNSTRRVYHPNTEYSSEAPGFVRNTTFAGGIGAAYSLTERFEVGLRYRYGFMNILKDPYPETKVQTIGLQLRYTLPPLFARRK